MTQKQKQLLLKDLCARLPYGVNIQYDNGHIVEIRELGLGSLHDFIFNDVTVKSYLRPMSSMTKKENEEWFEDVVQTMDAAKQVDFFNKHHLDYRDLIPMGLALEAPKDMYKI